MTADIIDDLAWRGLIASSTDLDAMRAHLADGQVSIYFGCDPTAPSLHAGHLIPLLVLKRFQEAGHRPILLAGGATGLIGDPRNEGERTLNAEDTVAEWADRIRSQLERFVSLGGENGAIVVNNLDWTGEMTVPAFLRNVGKHFSVNVMLSRDVVKKRLDTDGISYTEFSYMLLQANDFVQLRKLHGCTMQIGGSDQWGNIVAGVELNRRIDGTVVHALTTPLVTDSAGNKFSKSTGGGALWLDPEMTSPYSWYQFFVNAEDSMVMQYLRWYTTLGQEELDELASATERTPHLRLAQKRLAQELTDVVHGLAARQGVELASQALFGRGELANLDESTLSAALAETPIAQVEHGETVTIVDLFVRAGLSESKAAARRAVREGGAYVNNVKILDEGWSPSAANWLHSSWLVLRRGKKNFAGAKMA